MARMAWGAFAIALVILVFPSKAWAQACKWGRDPVTLRCLDKPATPPPPPPTLELTSSPTAQVYRIAESKPGMSDAEACDPKREGTTLLGTTPLVLTTKTGLKKGKQMYCFRAAEHAVRLVPVDVAASGPTRPQVTWLAPFATVAIGWGLDCAYRTPPSEVGLVVDGKPSLKTGVPVRLRLDEGSHKVTFDAPEFQRLETQVIAGKPGTTETFVSVCMNPDGGIKLSNKPSKHPLTGLFIRAQNKSGQTIWQGKAPSEGSTIFIPGRPTEDVLLSVYTGADFLVQIPTDVPRFEELKRGKTISVYVAYLSLPSAKVPDEVDRERVVARCRSDGGAFCSDEAFLLLHKDRRQVDDSQLQAHLRYGCEYPHGSSPVTACIARDLIDPTAERALKSACQPSWRQGGGGVDLSETSLDWRACLRLAQPKVSAKYFVVFSDATPRSSSRDKVRGLMIIETAIEMTADDDPAYLFTPLFFRGGAGSPGSFGGGIGFAPFYLAVVEADDAGKEAGKKWLGGAALSTFFLYNVAKSPQLELGAFVIGSYTASASIAGPYASLGFLFAEDKKAAHYLSVRGGYVHFPDVKLVGNDDRESVGGRWRPFLGLGYYSSFDVR